MSKLVTYVVLNNSDSYGDNFPQGVVSGAAVTVEGLYPETPSVSGDVSDANGLAHITFPSSAPVGTDPDIYTWRVYAHKTVSFRFPGETIQYVDFISPPVYYMVGMISNNIIPLYMFLEEGYTIPGYCTLVGHVYDNANHAITDGNARITYTEMGNPTNSGFVYADAAGYYNFTNMFTAVYAFTCTHPLWLYDPKQSLLSTAGTTYSINWIAASGIGTTRICTLYIDNVRSNIGGSLVDIGIQVISYYDELQASGTTDVNGDCTIEVSLDIAGDGDSLVSTSSTIVAVSDWYLQPEPFPTVLLDPDVPKTVNNIILTPTGQLRVNVFYMSGSTLTPLTGAFISFTDPLGTYYSQTSVNNPVTFKYLKAGSYNISAQKSNYTPKVVGCTITVLNVTTVNITLDYAGGGGGGTDPGTDPDDGDDGEYPEIPDGGGTDPGSGLPLPGGPSMPPIGAELPEPATPEWGLDTSILLTNSSSHDLWEYNTVTNTWTQKTDCLVYRQYPGSFNVGSIGYIVGGLSRNGVFQDAYSYNPNLNSWSDIATFPGEPRYYPIAFGTASYGYVGAGHNLEGTHLSDMYKYAVDADAWTLLTDYPGYKGHFKTAYTTEKAYMVGVECNNDTELYENNLSMLYFSENITVPTFTKYELLNKKEIVNSTNKIVTEKQAIKDGEIVFTKDNKLYTGLGLGNNYNISITPKPELSYYQVEYYICRIIPEILTALSFLDSPYNAVCCFCGKRIINKPVSVTIPFESGTDISHLVLACNTCNAYFCSTSQYVPGTSPITPDKSWYGGYINRVECSMLIDSESMVPKYPPLDMIYINYYTPINEKIIAFEDQYIINYKRVMRVVE